MITMDKAGFELDDIQKIINAKNNKLAVAMHATYLAETNQPKLDNLFGPPLLEKQVTISEKFSLDKNIVPKKEFKYGDISDYARDNYFGDRIISGQATLKIAPTIRKTTNRELDKVSNQKDALAIASALHNMLVADKHSLDQFKDRVIVIPVLSKVPDADDDLFCLLLLWYGNAWRWDRHWIDRGWGAGVHVASLEQ